MVAATGGGRPRVAFVGRRRPLRIVGVFAADGPPLDDRARRATGTSKIGKRIGGGGGGVESVSLGSVRRRGHNVCDQ